MSNQPQDLRKIEPQEIQPVEPDIKELIRTGGSAVTIITGLVILVSWVYNFSPLLFIPLTSVLVTLVFIGLYYFKIKSNHKTDIDEPAPSLSILPKVNEKDKTVALLEKAHQEQIDGWKKTNDIIREENEERIKKLETNHENKLKESEDKLKRLAELSERQKELFEEQIRRLEKELSDISWLEENAQMQRENIEKYVLLQRVLFCYIDTSTVPTLILAIEVKNDSYFEVEIDGKLEGVVECDVKTLRGHTYLNERSLGKIPPSRSKRYTIEVEITKEEKEFIESFPENHKIAIERTLRVDKLNLTIKGTNEVSYIIPKRLTIRRDFKVISAKEYERALEQFSQN